jgi:acetyltransferase-like isoleucine patch superfamily enzyme
MLQVLLFKLMNKIVWCYYNLKADNNGKIVKCNNRDTISISHLVTLINSENIYIGDNTYLNGGYFKASPNAKIVIGNNCLISYNVHIRTDMHLYSNKHELIRNQGSSENDIIIENDVWIGYGSQIMPGVRIGEGSVIAAGSVVTKNVEPYSLVAGIPAVKIKERG